MGLRRTYFYYYYIFGLLFWPSVLLIIKKQLNVRKGTKYNVENNL